MKMEKEVFFKQYAGRYRLVKMVIGGNDLSAVYGSLDEAVDYFEGRI